MILGVKCKVIKLNDGKVTKKTPKEVLTGKFIREYKRFYLFESEPFGWKECFLKQTIGIDWTIERK